MQFPLWYSQNPELGIVIFLRYVDFGTGHTGEQQRIRRACAYAQSRQSLRCSHTQSMDAAEDSDKNVDLYLPLDALAWAFKGGFCSFAISIKISPSQFIKWTSIVKPV